jgi:hypothetical protein
MSGEQLLKTYYTTSFKGYWPVGCCAIVQATNAREAAKLLNEELKLKGLPAEMNNSHMQLFSPTQPTAKILLDGNY